MTLQFSSASVGASEYSDIGTRLSGVDWSFSGRKSGSKLERIHPYPAKFIPDLPATLLEVLPIEQGTCVLDPFVGSGTTLVECQRRGIASVGIDLNPIACLLSRVKTSPTPVDIVQSALHAVQHASEILSPAIPAIPNLDHWFLPAIQNEVAALVEAIDSEPEHLKDVLQMSLSSILVKVSNQESDTRYAAVHKSLALGDVYRLFLKSAANLAAALNERSYNLTPSRVIEMDATKLTAKEVGLPVGAVITSPPYPNAYEYWLYHKYRMWWLGHDPLAVKKDEIGARAHFFGANPHTSDNFSAQMAELFSSFESVLVPRGFVCFVVGRSKIHGEIIDNGKLIEGIAHRRGYKTEFRTERVIAANRKSFNLSHANIKTETVLVLRSGS